MATLESVALPKAGFHIRPASLDAGDHDSMMAMYDSQIPWLRSIGAGLMWSAKVRGDPEREKGWHDMIAKCDKTAIGAGYSAQFGKDWSRAYIAEVQMTLDEVQSHTFVENEFKDKQRNKSTSNPHNGITVVTLPAGAIVVNGISSAYTREILPEQDIEDPFVFVDLLVTDRRLKALSQGAGAALIQYVKGQVIPKLDGITRLALDCFVGTDGHLVKYYEKQGFRVIGHFTFKKKEGDWNGAVLEMHLP